VDNLRKNTYDNAASPKYTNISNTRMELINNNDNHSKKLITI